MADIDVNSLEPNSHKYKAEKAKSGVPNTAQKSREKISPVIDKDQVVSTKKPLGKKFAETFMTEDTKDVKSWLIMDVLIPGIKNTILDILSMMFFGEVDSRSRRGRKRGRDDRTDYSSYYRGSSDRKDRDSRRRRDDRYDSDDRVDFRNIVLRKRDDAERLIEEMRRRIRNNDSASVADLLDLIDIPGRYTDNNWGWDDERDIGIRRVSSGYLIDVAEPKYLD